MTDHERRWPIQESAKSLDKSGYLGGNSGGPMSQLKPSAADKAEPRGTFPRISVLEALPSSIRMAEPIVRWVVVFQNAEVSCLP